MPFPGQVLGPQTPTLHVQVEIPLPDSFPLPPVGAESLLHCHHPDPELAFCWGILEDLALAPTEDHDARPSCAWPEPRVVSPWLTGSRRRKSDTRKRVVT